MRIKITKTQAERQRPGDKDSFIRDSEVVGLCLLTTPKGRKSWYLEATIAGKSRRRQLGGYPELTVEDARALAITIRAALIKGEHPDTFKDQHLLSFVHQILDQYLETRLPAVSDPKALTRAANLVKSEFGDLRLANITRITINQWMARTDLSPANQHHFISCFKAAWNSALACGKVERPNPLDKVHLQKPDIRARAFTEQQRIAFTGATYTAVEEASKTGASPFPPFAILMLYLTGYRRDEIRKIQLDQIDLDEGTITYHEHKTRTRQDRDKVLIMTPRVLSLVKVILETRKGLGAEHMTYLFPSINHGRLADKPFGTTSIQRCFESICKAAGLEGFVVHNLRSNFVTTAVSQGLTVDQIGGITGQSAATIRRHYIIHQPEVIRDNAQLVVDGL